MKGRRRLPFTRSVRAKLLVILAALSLPLLLISFIELSSFHQSLRQQAATVARMQSVATAEALASWLDANMPDDQPLTPAAASAIYQYLHARTPPEEGVAMLVIDAQGHIVTDPARPGLVLPLDDFPAGVKTLRWSDGVERTTYVKRLMPSSWGIAVGVPVSNGSTSRYILPLAATWASALLVTVVLAYWAVGRFTRPLRGLAATVSTFGAGDLKERAAIETDDEVGEVAAGFNVMASQLQARFDELQAQGAFIEQIINSLPLGLVVLDSDLTVRLVNPTFARFIGEDAASIAGRNLYAVADGLTALTQVIDKVRRTRRSFVTYGLPLALAKRVDPPAQGGAGNGQFWDVTIWPINLQGPRQDDLILILSEVSNRVRAEKLAAAAFAAERARAIELESLINQMNEGVVIINRQGHYRINPAAARIIGRSGSELRDGIASLLDDIALQDANGRPLNARDTPMRRALDRGETISGERLKILRPDGALRALLVSATPLVDEGGSPAGAVALLRDITEEVMQHEALAAAYDRLREHDRLKSAFFTNVSHEFRTPLNVIIGLAQLLKRDRQLPLAPVQKDTVERLERNARALLELVNDLLEYTRLEAGRSTLRLESVDVREVIDDVARHYAAAARDKNLKVEINLHPELGRVVTDRRKLRKALANLVSNAIKFTRAGAITITAAPVDDAHWRLEVRDTGIGLASEALRFIFDEFRQVDDRLTRTQGGAGLGLAITRKIVELLDGRISVESQPGQGSTFSVLWPVAARPRADTGSLTTPTQSSPAASSLPERPF